MFTTALSVIAKNRKNSDVFNRWMVKQNVHILSMEFYLAIIGEQTTDTHDNLDRSPENYSE